MAKIICDACGKAIKPNRAMILLNTATSTERWHLACCPPVREPEATSDDRKARAAA